MRIASSVFVRFYIHCVFFLLSFVFFTLIAYGWTSIRSLMFTCRKECALCAYLHFAFGQRICFLPLAVSVCLYACALFFAVTVECSRLKLTPKYRLVSFVCLFVCVFLFRCTASVACISNNTIENHKVSLPNYVDILRIQCIYTYCVPKS